MHFKYVRSIPSTSNVASSPRTSATVRGMLISALVATGLSGPTAAMRSNDEAGFQVSSSSLDRTDCDDLLVLASRRVSLGDLGAFARDCFGLDPACRIHTASGRRRKDLHLSMTAVDNIH